METSSAQLRRKNRPPKTFRGDLSHQSRASEYHSASAQNTPTRFDSSRSPNIMITSHTRSSSQKPTGRVFIGQPGNMVNHPSLRTDRLQTDPNLLTSNTMGAETELGTLSLSGAQNVSMFQSSAAQERHLSMNPQTLPTYTAGSVKFANRTPEMTRRKFHSSSASVSPTHTRNLSNAPIARPVVYSQNNATHLVPNILNAPPNLRPLQNFAPQLAQPVLSPQPENIIQQPHHPLLAPNPVRPLTPNNFSSPAKPNLYPGQQLPFNQFAPPNQNPSAANQRLPFFASQPGTSIQSSRFPVTPGAVPGSQSFANQSRQSVVNPNQIFYNQQPQQISSFGNPAVQQQTSRIGNVPVGGKISGLLIPVSNFQSRIEFKDVHPSTGYPTASVSMWQFTDVRDQKNVTHLVVTTL